MSCEIRFRLDSYLAENEEYLAAWKTIVKALTDSREKDKVRVELHEAISQKVQATATLHKNDAKIMKRSEGGFGGDSNECDRQIRFKARSGLGLYLYDQLEIHMRPSNGDAKTLPGDPHDKDPGNHKMEWTMPDLIDFKHAAMMALNKYLYEKANPGGPVGWVCLQAHVVFHDYHFEDEGTAAEKEAFEFYVNNYPNKKRKKRVIGTKTAAEQGAGKKAEIAKAKAEMEAEDEMEKAK